MQRPLYWLLVSDREKPPDYRLRSQPVVWCYFLGMMFWGLACAAFTQRVSWTVETDSTIVAIIMWLSTTLIFPLPTVVLSIREADRAGVRYTFEQLLVSAVLGLFTAVFLGAALEFTLSFAGIHHFLGIPINPWK